MITGHVTLFGDKNTTIETRGVSPSPKSVWSTSPAARNRLKADSRDGAVILIIENIPMEWQGPFKARNQMISKNILPNETHVRKDAQKVDLSFIQVEKLGRTPENRKEAGVTD